MHCFSEKEETLRQNKSINLANSSQNCFPFASIDKHKKKICDTRKSVSPRVLLKCERVFKSGSLRVREMCAASVKAFTESTTCTNNKLRNFGRSVGEVRGRHGGEFAV